VDPGERALQAHERSSCAQTAATRWTRRRSVDREATSFRIQGRCGIGSINGRTTDARVGITHHPSAPLPRVLLVADIHALLSFGYNGRKPDVYREGRGISTVADRGPGIG
jgi:hypothetical protein